MIRSAAYRNVIRTEGTSINIEAGSEFAPGKLIVLDRMTKTKVELPGDLFALEERIRVERQEENNAVVSLATRSPNSLLFARLICNACTHESPGPANGPGEWC